MVYNDIIHMKIFYYMVEAVPHKNNPDYKQYEGAYVNCWVKAASRMEALSKIKEYLKNEENWLYTKTEEVCVVRREQYLDIPESLAAFDYACENGLSVQFYLF